MAGLNFEYRHPVMPYAHADVEAGGFAEHDAALARLGREGWEVLSFAAVPRPDALGAYAAVYLLRRAAAAECEAGGAVGRPETAVPRATDPSP